MPTANSMGARRSEPSALLEKAAMNIHAYVVDHVDAPFRWEELTVDEPGPGEAVVKIVATGLCHTDLNT
ncbi:MULTISPECIES: hypothetical protein [Kocuria]|nr:MULTISPECIES: hypothetical protein [Kocuria]